MKQAGEESRCATKQRLAKDAAESARFYYETVAQLTEHESIEQRRAMAKAQDRANAARLALERHLDSHGC